MNFGVTNRIKPWKIKSSVCKVSLKNQIKFKYFKGLLSSNCVSPSALLPLGILCVISINSRLNEHQQIGGWGEHVTVFFGFDEVKDSITLGKSN